MKFLGWKNRDGKGVVVKSSGPINTIHLDSNKIIELYICIIKFTKNSRELIVFENGKLYTGENNSDIFNLPHVFDLIKPTYFNKKNGINRIPYVI